MTRAINIDHQRLHEMLWKKADSTGRLLIHQSDLREQLAVSNATLCRILQRMANEGRLKKIAARKGNIGVYVLQNPEGFLPSPD